MQAHDGVCVPHDGWALLTVDQVPAREAHGAHALGPLPGTDQGAAGTCPTATCPPPSPPSRPRGLDPPREIESAVPVQVSKESGTPLFVPTRKPLVSSEEI